MFIFSYNFRILYSYIPKAVSENIISIFHNIILIMNTIIVICNKSIIHCRIFSIKSESITFQNEIYPENPIYTVTQGIQ